jgi:hypothetical protein
VITRPIVFRGDLAVEGDSPNDEVYEVDEKALEWLDAGVRCVWVVFTVAEGKKPV